MTTIAAPTVPEAQRTALSIILCVSGAHLLNDLLQFLFAHINTPEFHVRERWRLGMVTVWDERAVQHRGVADFTGPRKLRRLTFKGTRPSL